MAKKLSPQHEDLARHLGELAGRALVKNRKAKKVAGVIGGKVAIAFLEELFKRPIDPPAVNPSSGRVGEYIEFEEIKENPKK